MTYGAGAGGILFIPALLMILFREKYPRWWFDWNRELLRFSNRVGAYLLLLDDRYPSIRRAAICAPRREVSERFQRSQSLAAARQVFLAIPIPITLRSSGSARS